MSKFHKDRRTGRKWERGSERREGRRSSGTFMLSDTKKIPPKQRTTSSWFSGICSPPSPSPYSPPCPTHTTWPRREHTSDARKASMVWTVTGGFSGYIPSCAWLSGQFDMIRSFVNFSVSFLTFGGLLPSHIYYVFPDKIICPPVPSFLLGVTGAKKNLANPITKKWKEPTAPITCLFVCSFVSSEKPI